MVFWGKTMVNEDILRIVWKFQDNSPQPLDKLFSVVLKNESNFRSKNLSSLRINKKLSNDIINPQQYSTYNSSKNLNNCNSNEMISINHIDQIILSRLVISIAMIKILIRITISKCNLSLWLYVKSDLY